MSGILPFLILTLFTILCFFYQQWHAGFASTFLFNIFLMLTFYEGLVAITMFFQLQAKRDIEKRRLQSGQSQRISIKITRKFPLPLVWYAVHDPWIGQVSGMPGRIAFPWFRKEVEFIYEVPSLPRGSYELTELNIVSGDVFGFVKRMKRFSITDRFLVLPSYVRLDNWSAEGGLRHGQVSVSKRIAEEITSVAGVRDYQYGDRLSQIHWKASARGQGLKTKEFELRTASQFAILLDTHKLAYSHKEFEKAVRLAASFVHFGYQRNVKYSLWYEKTGQVIGKEGSNGHDFYRIMEGLAVVQRDGESNFACLVQQALTRFPKETHLVFITTRLDSDLSKLFLELRMKKWKVEACLVSKPSSATEQEWIHKMQGSGVNCYRELA